MICPHCHRDVKYKERSGGICGSCRKRFALEPRENALSLHDVRLMRVAQKLSGNGSLRITTAQLYYGAVRKVVKGKGRFPFSEFAFTMLACVVLTVVAVYADIPIMFVPAVVITVGWVLYILVRIGTRRTRKIEPPMTHHQFVQTALGSWRKTYGKDMPGLVREEKVTNVQAPPPRPVLAVLSPNRSTLAGLRANDVPARHRVALAHRFDAVPAGVPVALLHDVSVEGYRFAGEARAAFGSRVVTDLTPRPRLVMAAKGALRLRHPAPPDDVVGWLRASRLHTDAEVSWLAKGWWTPLDSIRPSIVIGRVAAAAGRAAAGPVRPASGTRRPASGSPADPDQRVAEAVGFLSWPEPGRAA